MLAVTKDLEHIKKDICKYGYEAVTLDNYKGVIDTVIYDCKKHPGFDIPVCEDNFPVTKGIFLVNAHNRTIDEIISVLKNKGYSPLFLS